MKKTILAAFFTFAYFLSSHSQTVTWADNAACIFYTHCTKCHNPNGIGPFSLLDYQNAYDNRTNIVDYMTQRVMPPWPPDENYRSFAHERIVTQQEIDVITEWVNQGAQQGNAGNAPTPPSYGASVITNPDLEVQIPTWTLTNDTTDDYRCFVIPSGLITDSYITGMELLPGNRNAVHHIVLYQDTSGVPAQNDINDPGPGYTSFGGAGSPYAKMIGVWVPGEQPTFFHPGMGILLPANTNLVLQIHYPQGFLGDVDSTKIKMILTTSLVRPVSIEAVINHYDLDEGPLIIPADTVISYHGNYVYGMGNPKLTLLATGGHMHLIGKQIKSWGVGPSGDTIPFIDIPDWNFHWQGMYHFRQPVVIDPGTTIYGEATYDNTMNNMMNPNNPPQLVTLGEATTDEMMLVFFMYTFYLPGDENIAIDTVYPPPPYNGCTYTVGNKDRIINDAFQVFPNPAGQSLYLQIPQGTKILNLKIVDARGNTVKNLQESEGIAGISMDNLANGMYFIIAETENGKVSRKFVIAR